MTKISDLVRHQLPEFIREKYPNFIKFLEGYYEQQEYKGNVLDIVRNFQVYTDINDTHYAPYKNTVIHDNLGANDVDSLLIADAESLPDKNGFIKIDDEVIHYEKKFAVYGVHWQLINLQRGVSYRQRLNGDYNKTVAAPHVYGARVYDLSVLFVDSLLERFQESYLSAFPANQVKQSFDKRNLIKNIRDFYAAKGTEKSIKFLFASLLETEDLFINRFFPKDNILKTSFSDFKSTTAVEVKSDLDLFDLRGKIIRQERWGAYARVDNVLKHNDYWTLGLDNSLVVGEFRVAPKAKVLKRNNNPDYKLEVESNLGWIRNINVDKVKSKLMDARIEKYELNSFYLDGPLPTKVGEYVYQPIYLTVDDSDIELLPIGVVQNIKINKSNPYALEGSPLELRDRELPLKTKDCFVYEDKDYYYVASKGDFTNLHILNKQSNIPSVNINPVNKGKIGVWSDGYPIISNKSDSVEYGYIDRIALINKGYGYTRAPFVLVNEDKNVADAVLIGNVIDRIDLDDRFRYNYASTPPEVIITSGRNAVVHPVVTAGEVTSITIESPGEYYSEPPAVVITDQSGKGQGAFFRAQIDSDNVISGFEKIQGGRFYDAEQTRVYLRPAGNNDPATAIAHLTEFISIVNEDDIDLIDALTALDTNLVPGSARVIDNPKHSPIVGYAHDGNPIYGPFGYSSPFDRDSDIALMVSGYVNQKDAVRPQGNYINDYKHIDRIGALDKYNGRFCYTPEYPNGTYAYFCTIKPLTVPTETGLFSEPVYPSVIGNYFYGNPAPNEDFLTKHDLLKFKNLHRLDISADPLRRFNAKVGRVSSGGIDGIDSIRDCDTSSRFRVGTNVYFEGDLNARATISGIFKDGVNKIRNDCALVRFAKAQYLINEEQIGDGISDLGRVSNNNSLDDIEPQTEIVITGFNEEAFNRNNKIGSLIYKTKVLQLDRSASYTKYSVIKLINQETSEIVAQGIILENTFDRSTVTILQGVYLDDGFFFPFSNVFNADEENFLRSEGANDTRFTKITSVEELSENLEIISVDRNIAYLESSKTHGMTIGDSIEVSIDDAARDIDYVLGYNLPIYTNHTYRITGTGFIRFSKFNNPEIDMDIPELRRINNETVSVYFKEQGKYFIYDKGNNESYQVDVVKTPLEAPSEIVYTTTNKFAYSLLKPSEIDYRGFGACLYGSNSLTAEGFVDSFNIVDAGVNYTKLPGINGAPNTSKVKIIPIVENGRLIKFDIVERGEGFLRPKVLIYIGTKLIDPLKFNVVVRNGQIIAIEFIPGTIKIPRPITEFVIVESSLCIYPFSNSIGNVLETEIINRGYNFNTDQSVLPEIKTYDTIFVDTVGFQKGERIVGTNSYIVDIIVSNGLIISNSRFKVGDIIYGELSFTSGTIIQINSSVFDLGIGVTYNPFREYKSSRNLLGERSERIQDGEYYQDYSYVIQSNVPSRFWKEYVLSTTHPAGFRLFPALDIYSDSQKTISPSYIDRVVDVNYNTSDDFDAEIDFTVERLNYEIIDELDTNIRRGVGSITSVYDEPILDTVEIKLVGGFGGDAVEFGLRNKETNAVLTPDRTLISLDGVIQIPEISYNVVKDDIVFTSPPHAEARFYGKAFLLYEKEETANYFRTIKNIFQRGGRWLDAGNLIQLNKVFIIRESGSEEEEYIEKYIDAVIFSIRFGGNNKVIDLFNERDDVNIDSATTLMTQAVNNWLQSPYRGANIDRYFDGANQIELYSDNIIVELLARRDMRVLFGAVTEQQYKDIFDDLITQTAYHLRFGGTNKLINSANIYRDYEGISLPPKDIFLGIIENILTRANGERGNYLYRDSTGTITRGDCTDVLNSILGLFSLFYDIVINKDVINPTLETPNRFGFRATDLRPISNYSIIVDNEQCLDVVRAIRLLSDFQNPNKRIEENVSLPDFVNNETRSFELFWSDGEPIELREYEDLFITIDSIMQIPNESYIINRDTVPNVIEFSDPPRWDQAKDITLNYPFAVNNITGFGVGTYRSLVLDTKEHSSGGYYLYDKLTGDIDQINYPGSIFVFLDGVFQEYGASYVVEDSRIKFSGVNDLKDRIVDVRHIINIGANVKHYINSFEHGAYKTRSTAFVEFNVEEEMDELVEWLRENNRSYINIWQDNKPIGEVFSADVYKSDVLTARGTKELHILFVILGQNEPIDDSKDIMFFPYSRTSINKIYGPITNSKKEETLKYIEDAPYTLDITRVNTIIFEFDTDDRGRKELVNRKVMFNDNYFDESRFLSHPNVAPGDKIKIEGEDKYREILSLPETAISMDGTGPINNYYGSITLTNNDNFRRGKGLLFHANIKDGGVDSIDWNYPQIDSSNTNVENYGPNTYPLLTVVPDDSTGNGATARLIVRDGVVLGIEVLTTGSNYKREPIILEARRFDVYDNRKIGIATFKKGRLDEDFNDKHDLIVTPSVITIPVNDIIYLESDSEFIFEEGQRILEFTLKDEVRLEDGIDGVRVVISFEIFKFISEVIDFRPTFDIEAILTIYKFLYHDIDLSKIEFIPRLYRDYKTIDDFGGIPKLIETTVQIGNELEIFLAKEDCNVYVYSAKAFPDRGYIKVGSEIIKFFRKYDSGFLQVYRGRRNFELDIETKARDWPEGTFVEILDPEERDNEGNLIKYFGDLAKDENGRLIDKKGNLIEYNDDGSIKDLSLLWNMWEYRWYYLDRVHIENGSYIFTDSYRVEAGEKIYDDKGYRLDLNRDFIFELIDPKDKFDFIDFVDYEQFYQIYREFKYDFDLSPQIFIDAAGNQIFNDFETSENQVVDIRLLDKFVAENTIEDDIDIAVESFKQQTEYNRTFTYTFELTPLIYELEERITTNYPVTDGLSLEIPIETPKEDFDISIAEVDLSAKTESNLIWRLRFDLTPQIYELEERWLENYDFESVEDYIRKNFEDVEDDFKMTDLEPVINAENFFYREFSYTFDINTSLQKDTEIEVSDVVIYPELWVRLDNRNVRNIIFSNNINEFSILFKRGLTAKDLGIKRYTNFYLSGFNEVEINNKIFIIVNENFNENADRVRIGSWPFDRSRRRKRLGPNFKGRIYINAIQPGVHQFPNTFFGTFDKRVVDYDLIESSYLFKDYEPVEFYTSSFYREFNYTFEIERFKEIEQKTEHFIGLTTISKRTLGIENESDVEIKDLLPIETYIPSFYREFKFQFEIEHFREIQQEVIYDYDKWPLIITPPTPPDPTPVWPHFNLTIFPRSGDPQVRLDWIGGDTNEILDIKEDTTFLIRSFENLNPRLHQLRGFGINNFGFILNKTLVIINNRIFRFNKSDSFVTIKRDGQRILPANLLRRLERRISFGEGIRIVIPFENLEIRRIQPPKLVTVVEREEIDTETIKIINEGIDLKDFKDLGLHKQVDLTANLKTEYYTPDTHIVQENNITDIVPKGFNELEPEVMDRFNLLDNARTDREIQSINQQSEAFPTKSKEVSYDFIRRIRLDRNNNRLRVQYKGTLTNKDIGITRESIFVFTGLTGIYENMNDMWRITNARRKDARFDRLRFIDLEYFDDRKLGPGRGGRFTTSTDLASVIFTNEESKTITIINSTSGYAVPAPTISLIYEPQFLYFKRDSVVDNFISFDELTQEDDNFYVVWVWLEFFQNDKLVQRVRRRVAAFGRFLYTDGEGFGIQSGMNGLYLENIDINNYEYLQRKPFEFSRTLTDDLDLIWRIMFGSKSTGRFTDPKYKGLSHSIDTAMEIYTGATKEIQDGIYFSKIDNYDYYNHKSYRLNYSEPIYRNWLQTVRVDDVEIHGENKEITYRWDFVVGAYANAGWDLSDYFSYDFYENDLMDNNRRHIDPRRRDSNGNELGGYKINHQPTLHQNNKFLVVKISIYIYGNFYHTRGDSSIKWYFSEGTRRGTSDYFRGYTIGKEFPSITNFDIWNTEFLNSNPPLLNEFSFVPGFKDKNGKSITVLYSSINAMGGFVHQYGDDVSTRDDSDYQRYSSFKFVPKYLNVKPVVSNLIINYTNKRLDAASIINGFQFNISFSKYEILEFSTLTKTIILKTDTDRHNSTLIKNMYGIETYGEIADYFLRMFTLSMNGIIVPFDCFRINRGRFPYRISFTLFVLLENMIKIVPDADIIGDTSRGSDMDKKLTNLLRIGLYDGIVRNRDKYYKNSKITYKPDKEMVFIVPNSGVYSPGSKLSDNLEWKITRFRFGNRPSALIDQR